MTDFSKLDINDKKHLEELAIELFNQMSMRFKRRLESSNKGIVNIRRTIRESIGKGGLP